MPLVSVIIPTYNSSKYIEETLNAILKQTLQDFEIIIVDDCSTDDTVQKIRALNDIRIKIHTNEKNMGIAYTHNKLIDLCSGQFIAIQDHDDISYLYRLKIQSDYLLNNPDLIATASYANYIDENGNPINHPILRKLLRMLGLNTSRIAETDIFATLLFKNPFCHSTLMLNKKNMGAIRYHLEYKICDDYDLFCHISEISPIKIHSSPVLKYRVHRQNTSSARYKEREAEVNEIQGRYLKLLDIVPDADILFRHNGYFNDIAGFVPSIEYLKKSIEWYKLLIEKNNIHGLYPSGSLETAIENNWFERCYLSRNTGWQMLFLYYRQCFVKKERLVRFGKFISLGFAILFIRK